jgi:tetratricopeptide (TPR) repeat protein
MRQVSTSAGTTFFVAGLSALTLLAAPLAGQSIEEAFELHASGRLPEALRIYEAVAKSGRASDPAVAATALNNACVIRMDLGDFRAALPECEEALRLRQAGRDAVSIAETLDNLGLVLQSLGRPGEAEERFRESLGISRRRGDSEAVAITLGNLGALALSRDRYSRAMRLYTEAADLAARHRDEPWAAEQEEIARVNQGVVLEKVGAYREALQLYKTLVAEGRALDARRRAALLVNAGVIYRNLGDPVSAVESFQGAVAAYEETSDLAALSNAWLNLGIARHLNLERPEEAEAAFREALRLARESGDRTEEVQDLFYLGRLLLEQGRLGEAGEVFRRCLAVAEASGSAEGRWSAHEGLGRIAAAQGDLPRALGHLEKALEEIERVRAGLEQGSWRAGYFGDKRSVYAAAVGVLGRMGDAERAFGIVQRAKARDLLDALGSDGNPAAPLSASEIRERIGEDTVLEYFLGEDRLYLWVLRREGLRMADLGPRRPVLDDAVQVHRSLARGGEPDPAVLTRLSRALLSSAGPLPDGGRLRIAPDGLLHYLPFEILSAGSAPLVERAVVTYLPSASTLGRKEKDAAGPPELRLAGFGAPREIPGGIPGGMDLPPLPSAEQELDAIATLLGGRHALFTGGSSTEQAFRTAAASGARVVHFATHTVVDEGAGGGAAILLSPAGEEDGLLRPREIAALDGRTGLAVLAACRTALGSGGEDGRALASLTGSFLAGGSSAVVATLWDVGDAATAVFMEQLYAALGKGLPPAEALRRAKLRLRADPRWNRPALWAGYVLVGDAEPVAPRQGIRAAGWALGGAGLAAVFLLLARRLTRTPASRPPS